MAVPAVLILAGAEAAAGLRPVIDVFASRLESFADRNADVMLLLDDNPHVAVAGPARADPDHRRRPVSWSLRYRRGVTRCCWWLTATCGWRCGWIQPTAPMRLARASTVSTICRMRCRDW